MTKDEYDDGIIAKVTRAANLLEHLQAMQAELREGREEHQYERRDNARGDETNPIVWVEWVVTKTPAPLPLAFSALLGDVIHNLRAALDYSTWAAVDDGIRETDPQGVAFPLYDQEAKFIKWTIRKKDWYAKPTMDAIERAQPFKARASQLHPLAVLQQLSNVDKHRLLNVVEFAAFDLGPVGITPEPVVKRYGAATGRVEAGDVLVRIEFPRPVKGHEVELRPTFGWYESVPYERGGEVDYLRIDWMLNAIYQMVVTTASDMIVARRIERGEVDPNAEAERGN
ncbi:hypothetical protein [Actinomadura sp. 7K534]|uniref:hypothetical protein n=1 Tax=Actinomadura sp. 7K534 TaxID=2530366 RepID=UPI001046A776|nr:hypothetical protein [Actinomadura sp. 7K534]TDB96910.1 hypothetical protein E1266_08265 [Actinomadura sp. 7K534]